MKHGKLAQVVTNLNFIRVFCASNLGRGTVCLEVSHNLLWSPMKMPG
jgi:hypothetical protein